jgi:hypothetical protein
MKHVRLINKLVITCIFAYLSYAMAMEQTNFTIKSICMIHEKILGDFNSSGTIERQFKFHDALMSKTIELYDKYFTQWDNSIELIKANIYIYNSTDFAKIG